MIRRLLAVSCLAIAAVPAAAQYPYAASPANTLPNFYNRTSQPLSPYLNILRGGNPAVNYYYGVRPGTPAGGMMPYLAGPGVQPLTPPTGPFLPAALTPLNSAAAAMSVPLTQEITLPPSGHPVVYGNFFGFGGTPASVFAPGVAGRGMAPAGAGGQRSFGVGQQQQTPARPGTTAPPRR